MDFMQVYSQLQPEESQVVHTAWAVLALIAAGYHHRADKADDSSCAIPHLQAAAQWGLASGAHHRRLQP